MRSVICDPFGGVIRWLLYPTMWQSVLVEGLSSSCSLAEHMLVIGHCCDSFLSVALASVHEQRVDHPQVDEDDR